MDGTFAQYRRSGSPAVLAVSCSRMWIVVWLACAPQSTTGTAPTAVTTALPPPPEPAPAVDGVAGRAEWEAFVADPANRLDYARFQGYLAGWSVDDVVPAWHLWRQGTDWQKLGEPAFVAPPDDQWAAIVPTLVVIRDRVVPEVGPIEVVSGFRTEVFNARADGAAGSRHKWFEAVDVVPRAPWERQELHRELLDLWVGEGERLQMGLGLYQATRFHVDTHRFRRWGATDVEIPTAPAR